MITAVQYLSVAYAEHLDAAGIKPSTGAVGSSFDNALAESVIGLYKTELIKPRRPWKGLDDLEIATAEWVDWSPPPPGTRDSPARAPMGPSGSRATPDEETTPTLPADPGPATPTLTAGGSVSPAACWATVFRCRPCSSCIMWVRQAGGGCRGMTWSGQQSCGVAIGSPGIPTMRPHHARSVGLSPEKLLPDMSPVR